ncbi:motility associated factor glycosyltransferase family protein [Sporomusa aerivorans]|uniref:motility associated factor glycosyltransferase family protein n=1 Tax=Sporomusa aerivorans TaxID=204936 RepID=UPI00352BC588
MITKILQKNIEAIGSSAPFLLNELLPLNFEEIGDGIAEEIAASGSRDIYFCHDNNRYLLHSSYDPAGEAERIVKQAPANKDCLFVVYGLGLGLHLRELKQRISSGSKVIVIEHNVDVVKYVLGNFDVSDLFKKGQFLLLFGDQEQLGKMNAYLGGLNYYTLVHNLQVLMLPNYYVYAKENQAVFKQITTLLNNTFIALGNDLEDKFIGFDNMCRNTEAIMSSNSIEDIKDKYTNVPAIIVASGPSLDKNIEYLKEANGKALIIACDASMRACDRHGVRPDAIASIERVEPTYSFYYKDRTFPEDLVLLGPGSLWPAIYEEYPGKTIIMSRNNGGFEQLWMSACENFKFLGQGSSCATVAFGVARAAGCNPIILIGQDLAYTSGKKHSDLTHTEHEGANDERDSTTGIYVEDYEGNLLQSSYVFKMFKEWYELNIAQNRDLKVVDATEGGAYIKGTTLMTLREAIDRYCQEPVGKRLIDCLPDQRPGEGASLKKYEKLLRSLNKDLGILRKIQKNTVEHMKRLSEVDKSLSEESSEEELITAVRKLQRGDKIIRQIGEAGSAGDYFTPIIVPTIMEVKRLGNELTLENVKRNCFLQYNLMFMIANSVDVINKEYGNAQEILTEKRQQFKSAVAE